MLNNTPTPTDTQAALSGAVDASEDHNKVMNRDAPDPVASRVAAVTQWQSDVLEARTYWVRHAFDQMVADQRFVSGNQWGSNDPSKGSADAEEAGYVANFTLRHVSQQTATLYGKNPKIVARRKKRLLATVWDGSQPTLMQAQQLLQSAAQFADPNAQVPPEMIEMISTAQQIVADANFVRTENLKMDRMAQTLELLLEHELDEQPQNFKVQMKAVVRRALTVGVAYVKLGYQRAMDLPPEVEQQVADANQQLARLEQLAADRADGEFDDTSAKMDELQTLIQAMSQTEKIVVREGLAVTYPDSTAIIPDLNIRQLRGFVGSDWVAEEFFLSPDRIKQIYGKDVGSASANSGHMEQPVRPYSRFKHNEYRPSDGNSPKDANHVFHCVWEIYSKVDGMVYVVCDGYKDFLVEPSAPDCKLERFWPWFVFLTNEVYDDEMVFPPSDVRLMRDPQLEVNRARQGLREHRRAARPQFAVRKGALTEQDKEKLEARKPFDIIELQALAENQDIKSVLQTVPHSGVDPNLYSTSQAYEDYQRTLGQQQANLGGTSGATATEASIAEGSRTTDASSTVDDLDEFLADIARCAGQILFYEADPERVMKVIGPGAMWPTLSAEDVSREIYLDVEAASTGRPNRAAEMQVAQMVFPLLMQLPGINPEFLARELLRRADDRMDLTDAFTPSSPSIQAINAQAGRPPVAGAGGVTSDPNAQGAQGANNAQSTAPEQINAAPRPPQVDPSGPGI
jgi:hypothetical protein